MDPIEVSKLADPAESVIDSAERVAGVIGERLRRAETPVIVSMRGMRGVPSAFFNAILVLVRSQFGETGLQAVRFEFDSELQRSTFDRALSAARKAS